MYNLSIVLEELGATFDNEDELKEYFEPVDID